jgi:maleamate amidohydrolase
MAAKSPIPPFEDHCWKDLLDDELLEIYSSYQRTLKVGKNPALLAIDLYNSAYWGGNVPVIEANRKHRGSCGENSWRAIEPTKKLFAAARAAGIPVIYTTRKPDTRGVNSTHRDHGGKALPSDIYDIYEAFTPQPGELIIYKERASGFFGTPLVAHLRLMGCDSLIVCGESTSGCVRASVVEGYSYGYHITVAEECTYDRSMLSHKVNLFDLHHKYADVMKVEDVLAHLGQMAARKVA